MKYNIHTIPSHLPFADTLARWLLETHGDGPLGLSRALVLLPSRRAAQSMRDAFLRETGGRALLLPRMRPLDDVEEDGLISSMSAFDAAMPEPGFAFRRLFILARLVERYRQQSGDGHQGFDNALLLARDLARLMDEIEREGATWQNLQALAPDGFAAHWQLTVDFLQILAQHWPEIAAQQGLVSPEEARTRNFAALRRSWKETPPDYPVIAAGTTGSIPATAELLKSITRLPHGAIVLPGLDLDADKEYMSHIGECHPQWGMRRLLEALRYPREDVQAIGGEATARGRLLSDVMRPAQTTNAWKRLAVDTQALEGLRYVPCAHAQEEATVIALMLREALEEPQKTAALVTHDRALAGRVAAILHRFGVTIDDSAGQPLRQTPSAVFLRLILDAVENDAAPIALLSLLKHPLAHVGLERIVCLEAARALELLCLRKVGVPTDMASLTAELEQREDVPAEVVQLLVNLRHITRPFHALLADKREKTDLARLIDAHVQCAEALSNNELWKGREGDALQDFITQLRDASSAAQEVEPSQYPSLFNTLLHTQTFHVPYGMHPRLRIVSPAEARMQSFDRVILGGLNEGSWPPEPVSDPWFSRAMREQIGLPMPERRVGQAAHDFSTLACASEVFLTRAQKIDGAPTTASRWLVKLEVLLSKPGAEDAWSDHRWVAWAKALDMPAQVTPCPRPAPTPPLSARPRRLSVTQVETWQRDPYSIYAAHILRLRPLEALGAEPGNAEFGTAAHRALERFIRAYPQELPPDAYEKLLAFGHDAFAPLMTNAAAKALWWPRFERIAGWVIAEEMQRRHNILYIAPEGERSLVIDGFTLTGRADRIEHHRGGRLAIIDYKTGRPPADRQIEQGLASQLVLLALMFAPEESTPLPRLEYWHLQGGRESGAIQPIGEERVQDYMSAAKEGLRRLIETYRNPQFPYYATPIASRAGRYNDYAHLARVKEWG